MTFPPHVRVYVVGGAVRDGLLGLPVQDRDYVVVGATPEDMARLGFTPVGKDFPVFLHPESHEEYALARTERKTARGYKGFRVSASPEVTLEEDLRRRDLTVNAMALDAAGSLVDPYGGRADLENRLLRHVSPAFAEDPVRILRVARFSARFADFTVAPETMTLMRAMVDEGEVDALVPERVWQELARGLMEKTPSRMFAVLRECGALARLLPELDRLFGVPQPPHYHPEVDSGLHTLMALDWAAVHDQPLPVRLAVLLHDLGKGTTQPEHWPHHHGHEKRGVGLIRAVCKRLRIPAECRDLAVLTAAEHGRVHRALELRPDTLLDLLERADAIRRPERFADFLAACEADFHGRGGHEQRPYPQTGHLKTALATVQGIDAGAVASNAPDDIPGAIRAARLAALSAALKGTA